MRALIAWPRGNTDPQASWIDQVIADAVACKMDAIILYAGAGLAMWASDILPRASNITADYDPMQYAIERAHAAGLKFGAWWCPGLMPTSTAWRNRYSAEHPNWNTQGVVSSSTRWFNFDAPGADTFCASIVREIATRYTVDFIALDYIRYSYDRVTGDHKNFPQSFTANAVTRAVSAMASAVYRSSHAGLGAFVFAGWGGPTAALQLWNTDWSGLDFFATMSYVDSPIYAGRDQFYVFDRYFETWNMVARRELVWPTLQIRNHDQTMKTAGQLQAQIDYLRASGYGVDDLLFFDHNTLNDEIKAFLPSLAPAAPPVPAIEQYVTVINLQAGAAPRTALCKVNGGLIEAGS